MYKLEKKKNELVRSTATASLIKLTHIQMTVLTLPSHSGENVAGGGRVTHHLVCLTYASFHKLGMASSTVLWACLGEMTIAALLEENGVSGLDR